tara:strand:- start:12211 stop:12849 length:639 start_codon:yes stop_codon:yes gene_type:complete
MTWQGPGDFLERVNEYLTPIHKSGILPERGDVHYFEPEELAGLRDAGVLISVVDRGNNDLNVVLTQRPQTMAHHPGQVAFPGGKVDPIDHGPVQAALREAHEEVGVDPATVNLLGLGDIYVAGSGFRITPVVGSLPSDFEAVPDPYEVDAVFETPLSFLMNPENHVRRKAMWKGRERVYLEMPHNGRYIWGVTAGVIRALYDRLYPEWGKED